MNTIEAFYFAISKVNELKKQGIKVEITLYRKVDEIEEKELRDKYSKPENIPFENWCNINFSKITKEQAIEINEMANYLGMCGITFDSGGCIKSRDWEFDWSFSYIKGSENWEWKETRESVEEMIVSMSCYNER